MRQRPFFGRLASRNVRYKRHAVMASVGLHLLFVLIAALLFSGQRELNKDRFEASFVTLTPARRDAPIRPTRRNVTVSTPQIETAARVHAPKQLSNLRQPLTEKAGVVQNIPDIAVDPDVLNPSEMAVSRTVPGVENSRTASVPPTGISVAEIPRLEKSRSLSGAEGDERGQRIVGYRNFSMALCRRRVWEMGLIPLSESSCEDA